MGIKSFLQDYTPAGVLGLWGGDEEEAPSFMDLANQTGGAADVLQGVSEKIAPRQSQLQLDMLQRYGVPIAQAQQKALQQMYPETFGLQEQLAAQASEGLTAGLTPNEQRIVTDAIRGTLGDQAVSGLGVQRLGADLLRETRARQQQFQNLGTALSSRMPIFSAQIPGYTDFASQANFGQIAGLGMNQFNQQQALQQQGFSDLMSGLGTVAGFALAPMTGGASMMLPGAMSMSGGGAGGGVGGFTPTLDTPAGFWKMGNAGGGNVFGIDKLSSVGTLTP